MAYYIRQFDKAKNRLQQISTAFTEDILIARFVGGLKEDIKHKVGVLEPSTLNVAFRYALKYELDIEGQQRQTRTAFKPVTGVLSGGVKIEGKKLHYNPEPKTFEQKKALGLCYKCNEKYFPGHKCASCALKLFIEPGQL